MARCAQTFGADAADHVLDQIKVGLAPINVHLAAFSPTTFGLSTIRHGRIRFMLRASSPSFTVRF